VIKIAFKNRLNPQMLEDTDTSGLDESVVRPELDLLQHLEKITEAEDEPTDAEQELNKASSKVMMRSNPVFNFERQSSKVISFTTVQDFLINNQ
jgi:hypothetical protein